MNTKVRPTGQNSSTWEDLYSQDKPDGKEPVIHLFGAGADKMSFLSSFVAQSGEFVVRVRFGSTSAAPARFWHLFHRSLRGWDRLLANNLAGGELPESAGEIRRFVSLVNQAAHRAGKAVFVFEGFDHLEEGPVRELITQLVSGCSSQIAPLLISGERPGAPQGPRVRISRRVGQQPLLTREDLRIYYTALGVVLDKGVLEKLWSLTEGWPSAVCLLGNYLYRNEPLTESGIDSAVTYLYDYIQLEYHAPLRAEARQSLVLLSQLDSFTNELIINLTSLTVQEVTEIIHSNPFFLYHTDTGAHSLHRLYHQFLRIRQIEVSKKLRYAFLRKAGHWYEQLGAIIEPLTCYAGCGDYERMIGVLQKLSLLYKHQDQAARIAEILDRVPEDHTEKIPTLLFCKVLALYAAGEREAAMRIQRKLRETLECKTRTPGEERLLGEVYISEGFQAWHKGVVEYLRYYKLASGMLPEGSSFFCVREFGSPVGNPLRFQKMTPGSLVEMREATLESIPYVTSLFRGTSNGACYLAVAETHMYALEFDQARLYAGQAISHAGLHHLWGIICEANFLMMRIAMSEGNLDEVLYHCNQIRIYSRKVNYLSSYSILQVSDFHFCHYLSLHHKLEDWVRADPLEDPRYLSQINVGRELYVHATYMVRVFRQYYPALAYIDNALPLCTSNGMWFSALKLVLLKAIVYHMLGKDRIAVRFLVESYAMCNANPVYFSFVEQGEALTALIEAVRGEIREDEIPASWLDFISEQAGKYERRKKQITLEYLRRNPQQAVRGLEKLTPQEYQVLRMICAGMSTDEISQKLDVLQATVRTYLYRIYEKLGATDRNDAIRIAVTEGILEPDKTVS